MQFFLANVKDERRNLYMVLFDYFLYQINEMCLGAGVSEYSEDESRAIATLLIRADAPEALYISVKLGVEGVGELLRRPISIALSRYSNSERLNMVIFLFIIFVLLKSLLYIERSRCFLYFQIDSKMLDYHVITYIKFVVLMRKILPVT